jgi:phosphohistidine phosphatase SixA
MIPSRILVTRHAEKPDDPMNPDLSDAGCARAERLADYIPASFGSPEFLFSTAPSTHSSRPVETLTPLSKRIGVAIDSTFADQDYGALAQEILSQSQFTGKLILVCWHHGNIPSLMRALGAKSDQFPDPWDHQVFNLILQLDYAESSDPNTVSVIEPF